MSKHRGFTAAFKAEFSTNRSLTERKRYSLGHGGQPKRVPARTANGTRGISDHDAAILKAPPSWTNTKRKAKNGETIGDAMSAASWRGTRHLFSLGDLLRYNKRNNEPRSGESESQSDERSK